MPSLSSYLWRKLWSIWRQNEGLICCLPSSIARTIARTYFVWQWEWNGCAANAALWSGLYIYISIHVHLRRVYLVLCCHRANGRARLVCRKGLVSAGSWRLPEALDPGHRPVPCWALPGHGVNTEQGFGTLPPYKDYLLKDWNKTGRHAKLRSMHQLSPVWKGYCSKLKSVILCSRAVLSDRVWVTGKDWDRWKQRGWKQDMQIEEGGL